jgi:hypothetical protein
MRLTVIVITGGLLAALAASPVAADDLQRDRRDIRQDRREIAKTIATFARIGASCTATGESSAGIAAPAAPTR